MARLGFVEQLKWFDAVLIDVRESEETSFFGDDISYILHSRPALFAPKNLREPLVVLLFIKDVASCVIFGLLTEGQTTLGHVGIVIVIECGGTNVFVLLVINIWATVK